MEALKETQLYCPFAYIDGSWVAADSGEQINVVNPATQESMGDMPRQSTGRLHGKPSTR